ncbi:hypothetical protein [Actinomycetospora sp. CA-084318]|uniref:hypothetical protein n=1 Tax=Actinomycetospora sp. CA-084318 TaxID=3239892 RepID=UPI003D98E206
MESDSGDELTRSRHRRSAERGSGEPTTALPSWAQRHLDEAGTPAPAPTVTSRHRRAGRGGADSPLRGWGVAVLSVAAAVTAVPLAINAVANDRSDDPLPKVDTFTAGAPQALDGAQSGTTTRRGATDAGDPTGGVLTVPGVAPGAPQVAPAPVVVPAPQPAAVVRPTTPPAPTRITPRSAAPTTTTGSTTPTTTSGDDDGEGRSTTPKPKPTSSGSSGSSGSGSSGGSSGGGQKQDKGLLGNTVDAVGGVVGGVGGVAKGLL